jgi:hypothetical protein
MRRVIVTRRGVAACSAVALLSCAGTAIAAPTAEPADPGLKSEGVRSLGSLTDLSLNMSAAERAEAARAAQEFATRGRGFSGPVQMRDNLEGFTIGGLLPGQSGSPSFLNPPDFPWGDNLLSAAVTAAFIRIVDLAATPLGGSNGVVNASKAIEIRTTVAQGPGVLYPGASLRWGPILTPGVDAPAVGSSEGYITSVTDLYTFDTVNRFAQYLAGRLFWGGPCDPDIHGDCSKPFPQVDAPPFIYYLGRDSDGVNGAAFITAYCVDAHGAPIPGCAPPGGLSVGDPAPIPTLNWVRLAWSFSADGVMTALLDLQDGSGPVPVAQSVLLTVPSFNNISWNTAFRVQGESMFIDNIEASGYIFEPPVGPVFECPFLDDIEWLSPGVLLGQSTDWFAQPGNGVFVVEDGAQGQVLRQNNAGFGSYTTSALRQLPEAFAFGSSPWTVCFDASTTGETVRAFALDSALSMPIPSGVTTRLFFGRDDTSDPMNPSFDPTIFVQINADYDPRVDGPPEVGVDIVSTGYQWGPGQYREVCVTVDVNAGMTVSVDGAAIYEGSAFTNAVSEFAVESANTAGREGDSLSVDNVSLMCSDPSGANPPELVMPYCDDFEWATPGIPAEATFGAAGRYVSANGVTVEQIDPGRVIESHAVAMRNVVRNTVQRPVPEFDVGGRNFYFNQFTSELPGVDAGPLVGWRVSVELAMSDFTTSRGFSPAQASDFGPGLELVGFLWYHARNDRFYLFGSADGARPDDLLLVTDTGFTRAGFGIAADTSFSATAEYVPTTGKIRWSINGVVVGTTNPLVSEDGMGAPRLHRALDAIIIWSGNDATAPATPPLSTLFLDNLCVVDTERCFADVSGDGTVNFADINTVLSDFGASGDGIPGDTNLDGVVNFADLNTVLSRFGDSCD